MQVLLLSLGTLLLAVAGIVFTAMNWSQMDATTQGGVLVALTAAVAAATAVTARKGLPATAESLGLVSVVLALVDAHALRISFWPDAALTAYWAPALAAVAGVAWWLAAATGIRSTALAAVVMAQGPLFLLLDAVGADPTPAGLALLAQVALVLVVTAPRLGSGRSMDGSTRGFALIPAAWTWTIVSAGSIFELLAEGARSVPGAVAVLAAAAAVSAVCAALWAHEDGMRTLALVVATLLGTAAGGWAIRLGVDEATTLALVGLLTAAVAAVGLRTPARWGETPALVASWTAGLVACALLAPLERVLERLTWVASQAWGLAASESATAPATTTDPAHATPAVVALHLVGVAALILAWRPRIDRQHLTLAALGTWFGVVVLAPEMLPLSIGGAAALAWVSAVVAVGGVELGLRSVDGDERRAQRLLATGGTVATAFLGLAAMWSLGARPSSLVTGAAVVATAVWILGRGWWVQSLAVARLATGAAVVATAVEAAMVAATLGASTATAWAIAGAAGLAGSTLALLVLPGRLSEAGELAGWSLHGLSMLIVVSIADTMARSTAATDIAGPADLGVAAAWRIVLLSGVVAAGARTPRGPSLRFASLAAGEGLLLWWLEIASVGARGPEPYTLPLAAVLAVAALVAERRGPSEQVAPGTWVTWGPSLLVAAVPTVWMSLLDPHGFRPLVALVAAMVVLTGGAFSGRRAWVDVGAASVMVLGLARLVPVLADAPNWLTIGLTGAALVAVGATFEQRRRDVRGVRDRYSALR